jgi:hypothetical protein
MDITQPNESLQNNVGLNGTGVTALIILWRPVLP